MSKVCTSCGPRSIELFGKDGRNKDGLQSKCNICYNKERRDRYATDTERRNHLKQRQRKYNSSSNDRVKKSIKSLADHYIIKELKRGTTLTTSDIKQHPELIELKRQVILNKRLCRSQTSNS